MVSTRININSLVTVKERTKQSIWRLDYVANVATITNFQSPLQDLLQNLPKLVLFNVGTKADLTIWTLAQYLLSYIGILTWFQIATLM